MTDDRREIRPVIPMLARPLGRHVGPPNPDDLMLPASAGGDPRTCVWLAPAGRHDVASLVVNPGLPGDPEPLPWKRRKQ